jgi:Fe-S cluster assembly ATP-binding protein
MKFEDSKVYAILGPNGSGKTTLAKAIMGIQKISKGKIFFNSKDITKLSPEKRAKLGIFLGFQQTPELEVSLQNLLFAIDGEKAYEKINKLKRFVEELDIDLKRELIGLSGGEKKKLELFEFLYMQPKFAILDEPDSGVDIDSFKKIVKAIDFARKEFNPTLVIISHYENIFNYIEPSFVYVLKNGEVAKSGGKELIERIKRYGYE